MKTRNSFLEWVNIAKAETAVSVDPARFFNIDEKEYVMDVLNKMLIGNPGTAVFINDYLHLEKQRYHILENVVNKGNLAVSRIGKAIEYCSKPDNLKRKTTFLVNPNLSDYLAKSNFLWDDSTDSNLVEGNHQYLFIPSFMPIAPKEICLSNFNALLLDIKDYREVFSYEEFLELVSSGLHLDEDILDRVLLEFISSQVLYYGTILPVH